MASRIALEVKALMVLVPLASLLLACTDALPEPHESLPYEIVKVERLEKGGQLEPLSAPKYMLLRVDAALSKSTALSDKGIKATLADLVSVLRSRDSPDAISVSLYESKNHVGRATPLGSAEWWPKGHSLSPTNSGNIEDKESYLLKIEVLYRDSEAVESVSRLGEPERRRIFEALVRSEEQANGEADRAFPIDPARYSLNELRGDAYKRMVLKNAEEEKRLRNEFRRQLLEKFSITEDELQMISREAMVKNWPWPD